MGMVLGDQSGGAYGGLPSPDSRIEGKGLYDYLIHGRQSSRLHSRFRATNERKGGVGMATINKQTTRCVRCYKPAKFWSGYVLQQTATRKEIILAGWCSKRCSKDPAFCGHWRQEMGKGKNW